MSIPPVLSIVLPVYNEEEIIGTTLESIADELHPTGQSYEVLCVDDGSTDSTELRLREAASIDSRVRPISLSRNFGKESAILAGLELARGRAVIVMDADLQHSPVYLQEMLEQWEQGYDVVSGVKENRSRESWLHRILAGIFNRLMGAAAGTDFRNASDFKLLDRQVVDALLACPERQRFFRGLVVWVGFKATTIPITIEPRGAGASKWSTWDLIRYSFKSLLSFSTMPLRLISLAGAVGLILSFVLASQTLYMYLSGRALTGFTTVILLQLFLGSLLLATVGVVALYLSALYREIKARPVYLVKRSRESMQEEESSTPVQPTRETRSRSVPSTAGESE